MGDSRRRKVSAAPRGRPLLSARKGGGEGADAQNGLCTGGRPPISGLFDTFRSFPGDNVSDAAGGGGGRWAGPQNDNTPRPPRGGGGGAEAMARPRGPGIVDNSRKMGGSRAPPTVLVAVLASSDTSESTPMPSAQRCAMGEGSPSVDVLRRGLSGPKVRDGRVT